MSTKNIVTVRVQQNLPAASFRGFGKALLAGYHTNTPELQKEYGTAAEMEADGFAAGDTLYDMAVRLVANGYTGNFIVGRLQSVYTESYKVTPADVIEDRVYTLRIKAPGSATVQEATYTAASGDAVEQVCDGLKIAIDALSLGVTVTDNITDLDIDATTAGDHFAISTASRFEHLQIQDNTAAPSSPQTLADDLSDIETENESFYAVILDRASKAQATAFATWASTREVIAFYQTNDYDVITVSSSDVMSTLQASSESRIAGIWHSEPEDHAVTAWVGKILPNNPGSVTWIYKNLTGVTVDDRLTTSQKGYISAKNGTYFQTCGNRGLTLDAAGGKVADGNFIDIVRGTDWLVDQLRVELSNAVTGVNKLPYTDASVEVLKGKVRTVALRAVGRSVLDPEYTVTAPNVADVPAATRALRIFGDITLSGRYAGAIHKVQNMDVVLSF